LLPQVGEFFSCYGEVMDVVLLRDMRRMLSACEQVTKLEQKQKLLADKTKLPDSGTAAANYPYHQ
jgi:hypothetical protein